jgi:immunity protein 51 of polymorphic toxin system
MDMAKNVNEYAPCKPVDNEDGTFQLLFTDFDKTAATFEELDQEGGGYGWHGVVDALVRMKAPKLRKKVDYDPEGSMFVALSKDKEVLKQVAELIRNAVADPKLLKEAIKKADPDLMD